MQNTLLNNRNRLLWADALKGWLMIFVIIGHAIQEYLLEDCNSSHFWNIIYSFHMPAFMAVSGFVAYRKVLTVNEFATIVKKRWLQLMVPYLLWSILRYMIAGNYTISELISIILYPDKYYWFLWVLFWICIIFNVINKIADHFKCNSVYGLVVTCIILLGVMVISDLRILGFQFIAYYFIFYTIGYLIRKYDITKNIKPIDIGFVFAVWFVCAWFWKMHTLPTWIPDIPHINRGILQYAYRGITALCAIIILLYGAPYIMSALSKLNVFIAKTGYYSLGMYMCHLLVLGPICRFLQDIYPNITYLACITLTSVMSFVFAWLIIRLIERHELLSKLLLGKYSNGIGTNS